MQKQRSAMKYTTKCRVCCKGDGVNLAKLPCHECYNGMTKKGMYICYVCDVVARMPYTTCDECLSERGTELWNMPRNVAYATALRLEVQIHVLNALKQWQIKEKCQIISVISALSLLRCLGLYAMIAKWKNHMNCRLCGISETQAEDSHNFLCRDCFDMIQESKRLFWPCELCSIVESVRGLASICNACLSEKEKGKWSAKYTRSKKIV